MMSVYIIPPFLEHKPHSDPTLHGKYVNLSESSGEKNKN